MYVEYTPRHLDHLISAIWHSDSDVDPNDGHVVDPTLCSELVFKIYPSHIETVLSGPTTQQKRYPYVADTDYWGIRFAPGVGPIFSDIQLKELKNSSVDVDRILGASLTTLAHQLHDSASWPEQQRLIETLIRQQYPERLRFLDHNVSSAISIVRQCHGAIPVAELASRVGVSKRHLERQFLRHTGLSPKAFCKTVRLQRVLAVLQNNPSFPLATLALDCGYTDQAHLANEFKRTMGTSIVAYKELFLSSLTSP